MVAATETALEIIDLTPGQEYTITVYAVQNDLTEDEIGTAVQRIKPTAPTGLTAGDTTFSTIDFTWNFSPGDENLFDGFEIEYSPVDGQIPSPYYHDDYLPFELTLTGLNPNTAYTINVYTVSGIGSRPQRSNPTSATFSTNDAQPGDIIIKEVSTDTIKAMWIAYGTAQGYNIKIQESGSDDELAIQCYAANDGTEHVFTGLTAGQLYTITLEILGSDNNPNVEIRTYPERPGNVYVGSLTATSISIAWDPASSGIVHGYSVMYYPSEGIPMPPITYTNDDDLILHMTMLRPETTFNIVITSFAGAEEDQQISMPRYTTQRTDILSPLEVIIRKYTTSEIDIMWGRKENDESSIYLITLNDNNGNEETTAHSPTDPLEFSFTSLTPGSLYMIGISLTIDGDVTTGEISQRTKPLAPLNLTVTDMSVSTIDLSWDAPSTGLFDNFVISYFPVDGLDASPLTLASHVTTMAFTGLSPNQQYTFELFITSGSDDDMTQSDSVTESVTTDSASPGEIVIKAVSTTSIYVTWGSAEDGTVFSGYLVRIEPEDAELNVIFKLPSDELTHLFDGLTPGQEYNIYVQLQGVNVEDSLTQRTVPLPPKNIIVTSTESTSLLVIWEQASGVVQTYEIYYVPDDGEEIYAGTTTKDDITFTVTGLNPGSQYDVSVNSKVGTGDSALVSEAVTSPGTTAEMESNKVIIKQYSLDNIDIIWNTDLNPSSTPGLFLVSLSPEDGGSYPQAVQKPSSTYVDYSFFGLMSGRLYTITVEEANSGNNITATQYTKPATPGYVTVTSYTTTTVTIDWEAASGDADGYLISYIDSAGTETSVGMLTLPADSLEFQVDGLEPRTEYMFKVVTYAGSGSSRVVSDPVTISNSTEEVPADTIGIQHFDTSKIEILWSEVEDPMVTGYLLSIDPADGDNPSDIRPTYIAKDPTRTSINYSFLNLVAGRMYSIRLQISGPNTVLVSEQRTLPNPVGAFFAGQVTATTISVFWDSQIEGELTSYKVTYNPPDGRTVSPTILPVDGNGLAGITLQGLSPDTSYMITVVTISGGGLDATTSTPKQYTQTTAAIPEDELLIKAYTSSFIEVLWAVRTGPEINGYLISIDPADGGNPSPTSQKLQAKEIYRYNFTGLSPGREYTMKVEIMGTQDEVTTTQRTVPASPGVVVEISNTPTSITFPGHVIILPMKRLENCITMYEQSQNIAVTSGEFKDIQCVETDTTNMQLAQESGQGTR
ncbi:fibronectin-like [Saccoglossus kowalevskii]